MKKNNKITAAQEILLAASDLASTGKSEFSEWDLTVAAWRRSKNRFGCRGYEDLYPDHKRVMMEIMSKAKQDNPIRQGLLEKVRPNYYRITSLGLAESQRVLKDSDGSHVATRSAQPVYDAIAPYVFHPAFRKFLEDASEPRTWLEAEAFLNLTKSDAGHLMDCLTKVKNAIQQASSWVVENKQEFLRSGVSGGKKAIKRLEIQKLPEFLNTLETRFKIQMDAIRRNR